MTLTMRASIKTPKDQNAIHQLANYCERMRLNLSIEQINNSVKLTFSGQAHQLQELNDYLTEKHDDLRTL